MSSQPRTDAASASSPVATLSRNENMVLCDVTCVCCSVILIKAVRARAYFRVIAASLSGNSCRPEVVVSSDSRLDHRTVLGTQEEHHMHHLTAGVWNVASGRWCEE